MDGRSTATQLSPDAQTELHLLQDHKISPAVALHMAENTLGHSHQILNLPTNRLRICTIGCHGDKDGGTEKIMALLNEMVAKHPELKPDIILILGDNYYPDGLQKPDDPRVQSQFYNVFANPEFEHICNIPCIVILGNHDAGRDTHSYYMSYTNYVPYVGYYAGVNPLRLEAAELQQVAHTYLVAPETFQQTQIDYADLPKHCMPSLYHSWTFDNVELFGLNSNTYASEFLQLLKAYAYANNEAVDQVCHLATWLKSLNEQGISKVNINKDETIDLARNQAAWLEKLYAKAKSANRATLFSTHHPLFTCGKRHYPGNWDAHHYLNSQEITLLNAILQLNPDAPDFKQQLQVVFSDEFLKSKTLDTNANYNDMLAKIICQFQKMSPDMVCSAHDHSIYYYNNQLDASCPIKICQSVSGGGSKRDKQYRFYFGESQNVGSFNRDQGLTFISCDKNNPHLFQISIHTLSWAEFLKSQGKDIAMPQCLFTNLNSIPIRQPEENDQLTRIRQTVLAACETYLAFLEKEQGTNGYFFSTKSTFGGLFNTSNPHKLADVDLMHDIINFFNCPQPFDYATTIDFLFKKLKEFTNKDSENALYKDIQDRLTREFGEMKLEEMHAKIFPVVQSKV